MLALPFVVFVAWRVMTPDSGPSRSLVIAVAIAVGALLVMLLMVWYADEAPPTAGYVPAQQESGRIIPQRVLPRDDARQ
jgi:hypothetical protein